ncbi:MAG: hypothetical protein HND52_05030 [Ignavibacteriae bacterium]|nr:hypothetical protein [Ignavibacteriota bacterium]
MKNKNGIIKLLVTIFFAVSSLILGTDMTPTSMGSCTSVTLIPGIEISFTGLGSHDNDNQSEPAQPKWEWNFNYDKNDPWSYDISTTSIDVEWVFSNDGPYNIAVKYYDDDGSDGNIYRFTITLKSTRRTYYVKDHLGSIRMTLDENGEIVSAQDYHPYGEILRSINNSSVNEKYKFIEKEKDTETQYDYINARYFNSEIGSWGQTDAINQYTSPYTYSGNNPVNEIDRNGLFGEDVHFDLTLYMAMAVMRLTIDDAREIAEANQSVDENIFTRSENPANYNNVTNFHFESTFSRIVVDRLVQDPSSLSNSEFGFALHAFQDINFAHKGFKAVGGNGGFGHVFSPGRDLVAVEGKLKDYSLEMIKATYELMKEKNGGVAFISFEDLMENLNNYVMKKGDFFGIAHTVKEKYDKSKVGPVSGLHSPVADFYSKIYPDYIIIVDGIRYY